jgi:hypothetical protein
MSSSRTRRQNVDGGAKVPAAGVCSAFLPKYEQTSSNRARCPPQGRCDRERRLVRCHHSQQQLVFLRLPFFAAVSRQFALYRSESEMQTLMSGGRFRVVSSHSLSNLGVARLGSRDRLKTCHGELAQRQHVVAVALFDLQHLVDLTDGKNVGGQGIVDAADEATHAF